MPAEHSSARSQYGLYAGSRREESSLPGSGRICQLWRRGRQCVNCVMIAATQETIETAAMTSTYRYSRVFLMSISLAADTANHRGRTHVKRRKIIMRHPFKLHTIIIRKKKDANTALAPSRIDFLIGSGSASRCSCVKAIGAPTTAGLLQVSESSIHSTHKTHQETQSWHK